MRRDVVLERREVNLRNLLFDEGDVRLIKVHHLMAELVPQPVGEVRLPMVRIAVDEDDDADAKPFLSGCYWTPSPAALGVAL